MMPYYNILSKLLFLFACFFVFFNCSKTDSSQTDTGEVINYEDKLDELNKQASQLIKYGDPAEFILRYKEAVPLLEKYPDTTTRTASIRLNIIQKLSDIGLNEQALKQSYRALEANHVKIISDSITNSLMIYGKLLHLYEKTGPADSVFSICQTAVNCVRNHPDSFWLSSALNNAGFFFQKYGNNNSAMNYYLLSDSILNTRTVLPESWYYFQGSVKDNMAKIYEGQNDFEEARDIYAINFAQRYKNNTNLLWKRVNAGISLVNAEIQLANYVQAKKNIDQTELLFNALDHPDKILFEIDFLKVKLKFHDVTGDVINGFTTSKRLIFLMDSLNNLEENFTAQTMNTLATFISSQFEIALQKEQEARQSYEQRAKLRLWIILLVIFGSVAASVQLITFQKQRVKLLETDKLLSKEKLKMEEQKQQLLSLQLESKKKDLTDMAISLHQKQQWAQTLNLQMKKINTEKGYKRSRELKKLQNEIRGNVTVDKNLEVIQQNINTLSNEFYDKLNKRFPGLTKSENKLCSYIKLNLNTSQIAQLQNIDPASVKMSRYRLKKKLNLGVNQKLDIFIQNFDL